MNAASRPRAAHETRNVNLTLDDGHYRASSACPVTVQNVRAAGMGFRRATIELWAVDGRSLSPTRRWRTSISALFARPWPSVRSPRLVFADQHQVPSTRPVCAASYVRANSHGTARQAYLGFKLASVDLNIARAVGRATTPR